jgi:tRNA threonylcarbamoyl adenosine modification protein YeaZ
MRTLAIETASEACSVALYEGACIVARDHRVLGRGHAEQLVPMIASLPDKGSAHRIVVSLGPGSFTGVRIGIATARALGFARDAEVHGYPTLALVSAIAAHQSGSEAVTVCMNGGHGEWFIQNFASGLPQDEVRSLAPEASRLACLHNCIAGNRASELCALFDGEAQAQKHAFNLLPDAGMTHLLSSTTFTADLAPIYGRAPDATPQKAAQL